MPKVTRYHDVQLPTGDFVRVPYEVDEALEAAKGLDPDFGRASDKVLHGLQCALDGHGDPERAVHPGRQDVQALAQVVRRLVKLIEREMKGIGTSPSEPAPVVEPAAPVVAVVPRPVVGLSAFPFATAPAPADEK